MRKTIALPWWSLAVFCSVALLSGMGCGGESNGDGAQAGQTSQAVVDGSVHVNQVGYLPSADKIATVVNSSSSALTFTVVPSSGGTAVFTGETAPYGSDAASGDTVHKADFSTLKTPGTYKVVVGSSESVPFAISATVYSDAGLAKAAMKYFYFNRTGAVTATYLDDITNNNGSVYERPDERGSKFSQVPAFLGWTTNKFNMSKYHWDAGDPSIYPENTATFMALLMNMYERYKSDSTVPLSSFSLNTAKGSGISGLSDLLDEIAYDGDTMQSMLPSSAVSPDVALASQKVGLFDWFPYVKWKRSYWGAYTPRRNRDCNFSPYATNSSFTCSPTSCTVTLPSGLSVGSEASDWDSITSTTSDCVKVRPVFASKGSVGASYAVARYLAQLARLLPAGDKATSYWTTAKAAYAAAKANPTKIWKNNMGDFDESDNNTNSATDYSATPLKYVNSRRDNLTLSDIPDYNEDGTPDKGDINTPRGSGPYDDPSPDDDQYAAAVELYLTAYAKGESTTTYKNDLTASPHYRKVKRFDWAEDGTFGSLSLLNASNDLPSADISTIKENVMSFADYLMDEIENQGYPSAVPRHASTTYGWTDAEGLDDTADDGDAPEYRWGSNKDQAYAGIILVQAYELSGDTAASRNKDYLRAAYRVLDYILGNNAVDKSMVTGFGTHNYKWVHHRATMFVSQKYEASKVSGKSISDYRPPKGMLVGGPMSMSQTCGPVYPGDGGKEYEDERATPRASSGIAKAKRIAAAAIDVDTETEAEAATWGWCSLEVTGDWNAGLAYLAYLLGEKYQTVLASTEADVDYTLTVNFTGNTFGVLWTDDGSILCPYGACSATFEKDRVVKVYSGCYNGGVSWDGWSGDCTGTGACQVTMTGAKTVTGQCNAGSMIFVEVKGSGTVSTADGKISNCSGSCQTSYKYIDSSGQPNQVTFTATPASGKTILWLSPKHCEGITAATCNVTTAGKAITVAVQFLPQ